MTPRLGRLLLLSVAAMAASPARAAAPIVYMALGDSTAVGLGAAAGGGYPQRIARRLEQSGLVVKYLNVAASGATAADLRDTQLPKVMSTRPNLITIGIGLNDVISGRTLRDFARDLEIVADLVKRTKATVVVSTLPDLTYSPSAKGAPASLGRRIEAFNAAIKTTAERHGFLLADIHAPSRRAVKDGKAVYAADGFHPSAEGYELWAAALWPAIEGAVAPKVQARRPADR